MKPFYTMDQHTKNTVLELTNKCKELNLGNISFTYFASKDSTDINFYITEYKSYWELIVKQQQGRPLGSSKIYFDVTDIYKIKDNDLIYEHSEEDLI